MALQGDQQDYFDDEEERRRQEEAQRAQTVPGAPPASPTGPSVPGGPSNEDRLRQEYQDRFGRAPDQRELASGLEAASKYGNVAGELKNIQDRATNRPTGRDGQPISTPAMPQQPSQAWNQGGQAQGMFPDWYRELMTRNLANQEKQQVQNQGRADSLFSFLNSRATQGLNVSAQDPIISAQTNAYRAEQERARRNFLSDAAEKGGSLANLRGERRMAAEKVGQNVSGFQAQLIQRELMAKREEIAQAIQQEGAQLSADKQRELLQLLATYDQAIKEAQVGLGQGQLGLGYADLGLRGELGRGQLALGNRSLDTSNDEFMRELALRQWSLGDQSDLNWAQL